MTIRIFEPIEAVKPAVEELTELVRGQDRRLLERYEPLARRQSLFFDFSAIRRVDAAGVAALVSLYRIARQAGHNFTVLNASRHVEETLALLGLDQILLSQNAVRPSHSGSRFERPAA